MTLDEFRKLVRSQFGADLRHMTPANVREFLDLVHMHESPDVSGKFYINEPERTFEGIVRDFLRQMLDMPADQAVIRLWLYSLEMTVDSVNEIESGKFERLFAALGSGDE